MDNSFDKILASRPVNQQAARVLGKGVDYTPTKKITQRHWSSPPPTMAISDQLRRTSSFVDLTGRAFGRFKVVGMLNAGRWLCRCSCGDYETRRHRAILNPENFGDRCENCRHLAFLKRREVFDRSGKDCDVREL
jgi:hypothetical protein